MSKVTIPRAAGFVSRDTSQADMDAELPEGSALITTTQADAYADAKVREALEKAAEACTNTLMMGTDSYCGATASYCADRIRGLIPPDSRPGQP